MINKKYIAICFNVPLFNNNKLLDEEFCKTIYGVSWVPILSKMAKKYNYEVISGDIALQKDINPKKIFVIQELNARHGKKLLKKGAIGAILTVCESPIISFYFYDRIKIFAEKFIYVKTYDGNFDILGKSNKNINLHFPSYFIQDKYIFIPWENRKMCVMVSANKHYDFNIKNAPKKIKDKIRWIIVEVYKIFSKSFKNAYKNELYSKKIEIIKYFGAKLKLDLFGLFWLDLNRLINKDIKELEPILIKLSPSFCDNKIEIIKNYKYVFCLENIRYKGYVSEKIIDCFMAGTIPIYLGATNIEEFIPQSCFIDLRNYNNMEELELYLDSMPKDKAIDIIKNGKSFLNSDKGKKFSYEYFAEDILNMVKSIDDKH